jgi:hypothetical protein
MKINEPYKFLTYDNFKTFGFVMLIVVAVNLIGGIGILLFSNETISFGFLLNQLTPSLETVTVIVFVYSIVTYKSSLSIGNQFGRTRLSMMISNTLSMATLILAIAFIASFASVAYLYEGGRVISLYKGVDSNGNLFIKEFFWIFTSLLNIFAIGIFISSIWNRVKPIVRLILFVGIPVLLVMFITRIVMSLKMNNEVIINFFLQIAKFFGYSDSGINILQNTISMTFVVTLPFILLTYLIANRSTLNDKK